MVSKKTGTEQVTTVADALYCDGETGQRHSVALRIKSSSLLFRLETGKITEWAYRSLDHDRSIWGKKSVHLYSQESVDAELVIKNSGSIKNLRSQYTAWRKSHIIDRYRSSFSVIRISLLTCICFIFLWFLWPLLADHLTPYVSKDIREQLGELTYSDYVGSHHVCQNPKAAEAFSLLEERLLADKTLIIKPKVIIIRSGVINAVTLPDNRVVFSSALLEQAQSGDEVAGVLAHEFGHAIHDHVVRSVLRRLPAMIIIHTLGQTINVYSQAFDLVIGNAFSQRFESEADQTGLDLLEAAHISNIGLVNFFERLDHEHEGMEIKYLSTHPPSKERAAKISERVIQNPQPVLTEEAWQALHYACRDEESPLISHKIGKFLEDHLTPPVDQQLKP